MMPGGKIARSDLEIEKAEIGKEGRTRGTKNIVAIKIYSKFSVIDMKKKNHCYIVYRYNPIS